MKEFCDKRGLGLACSAEYLSNDVRATNWITKGWKRKVRQKKTGQKMKNSTNQGHQESSTVESKTEDGRDEKFGASNDLVRPRTHGPISERYNIRAQDDAVIHILGTDKHGSGTYVGSNIVYGPGQLLENENRRDAARMEVHFAR